MSRAGTAYTLRPAKQSELPRLQAIERAAAQLFPEGRVDVGATLSLTALATHLEQQWLICVSASGHVAAASGNDTAVGFLAATPEPGCLHINELSVHPDHGRRGLGGRLMAFCIARARQQRIPLLTLTTFADLPWNAPFYRRFGFRSCGPDESSPQLEAQLNAERSAGMTHRIAMQLRIPLA